MNKLLLLLLLSPFCSAAQTLKVVDTERVVIPSAHVISKNFSGISDSEGLVRLDMRSGSCQDSLSVQHLGFKLKKLALCDLKRGTNLVILEPTSTQLPELYIGMEGDWTRFLNIMTYNPRLTIKDSLISYDMHFVEDSLILVYRSVLTHSEGITAESRFDSTLWDVYPSGKSWRKFEFVMGLPSRVLLPNISYTLYSPKDTTNKQLYLQDNIIIGTRALSYASLQTNSTDEGVNIKLYFSPSDTLIQSIAVSYTPKAEEKNIKGFTKRVLSRMMNVSKPKASEKYEYGFYNAEREVQLYAATTQFNGVKRKRPTYATALGIAVASLYTDVIAAIEKGIKEGKSKDYFMKFIQFDEQVVE